MKEAKSLEREDHPRGCGEKAVSSWAALRARGSSPRVRGKEEAIGLIAPVAGIIPAGAGKRRI